MGCAFRTETYLSLDLPNLFWKKLTKDIIIEQDLFEIDQGIETMIKYF